MKKKTNRFSSMYKKGGEKQEWISNKIATLLEEDPNMPQKQAISIALNLSNEQFQDGGTPKKPLFGAESMFPISRVDKNVNGDYIVNYTNNQIEPVTYSKEDFEAKLKLTQPSADAPGQYDPYLLKYMGKTQGRTGQTVTYQNGGDYSFNSTPNFKPIEQPKVQGFGYDPNFQSQISPTSITAGEDFKKDNPLPQGTFQADPFGVSANKELETPKKTTENFQPMQFFNPYAGVDLAQGANALGQSIENRDALGIVAGGLKTLTGTARNIFGGMGQARIKNEGIKNYMDAQRDNIVGKSQQGQNGGAFPNFQDGGAIYPMEEPIPYESFPNGVYEAPAQQFPTGIYQAPEVEATPTPSFDTNSARDTWVQKTGLPWSEAKKLGYTDGSAKDNKKLLSELNDPRFKKEYLRTEPVQKVTKTEAKKIIPKAEATPQIRKDTNYTTQRPKIPQFVLDHKPAPYINLGEFLRKEDLTKPSLSNPYGNPKPLFYQDGGEQQDPLQMVSEALQSGATEEQIAQILMQQGYSEEEIGQIFQQLQGQQSFQDGGEQQGQAEQIYQMVAEALQSGADPQEIAQQLMQMGLSKEEVMQIIQEVMSQMQQPTEPQQTAPQMKMGGSFDQLIGKKILGYEYNKDKDTYSVRYE